MSSNPGNRYHGFFANSPHLAGMDWSAQQQQQYPPPPPPQTRTQQFRTWYEHQLATLTFNSRPIIDRLSMAAWERAREGDQDGMQVVGEVLREGIERAPPTQKLPLFYLLDSISKNAGPPYTTYIFPQFLAQVYLRAYSQVDGLTKKKMEDMLTTWRTTRGAGTPEGELFPRDVRNHIEQAIYGRMIPAPMPPGQMPMQQNMYPPPSIHTVPTTPFMPTPPQSSISMAPPPPHSAGISRDSVTTTLLTTLSLKRALLAKNPHDTSTQSTVGILEQLQAHLNAGSVSQAELVAIQQQLEQFRANPSVPSFPSSTPAMHPRSASSSLTMPQPVPYSGGFSGVTGQATQSPRPDFSALQGLGPLPGAAGGASAAPAGLDFSSLLGNLARAGILSHTGTPVADGATTTTPRLGAPVPQIRQDLREASVGSVNSRADGQHEDAQVQTEDEPDGMEDYEELILRMNVQLTLADLSQQRDFQPTSHLPNRCSQCAARFAAGKTGKDRLQAHLDWHFRRNRKERESEGRGANRRWLPRAELWVNDIASAFTGVRDEVDPESTHGSTHGMAPRPGGSDVAGSAVAAKQRNTAELQKKWVTMPPNPAGKKKCPICKEEFVDEFVQDEEEWIWRNCVKVKNSYYHATCRADALATAAANRKAVATASDGHNLRAASPSGTASRENTPPASAVGVKPETVASPLRQSVKMENVEQSVAGPDKQDSGADNVAQVDGKLDLPTDRVESELGSLKRKAEGSPEHADKEVKKEKSE